MSASSPPTAATVQSPLNLIIPLRPPLGATARQLTKLLKERVSTLALNRIGIVHFGRFFVTDGKFMLFTTFDGRMSDYILDFAMDPDVSRLFNLVLEHSQDKDGLPLPLPVEKHPHQFVNFIERHCEPELIWYSGYRDLTVQSIHNADQWRTAGRELIPKLQKFMNGGSGGAGTKSEDVRTALKEYVAAVSQPTAKQLPTSAPPEDGTDPPDAT